MPATRQVFIGLSRAEILAWYGLIVVSTSIFVFGAAQLVAKYRQGRAERVDRLGQRLVLMAQTVFSHRWIARRDKIAGIGHALVFYGFLLLFAGTTILGIDNDFTVPVFHWRFWEGAFFLGYKLVLDVAGLLLLTGLGMLAYNRWGRRVPRLEYLVPQPAVGTRDRALYRAGDRVFVATLVVLAGSGFLLEGLALAQLRPSYAPWSPVGWILMRLFVAIGLSGSAAGVAHHVVWWFHGLVALSFVASIPFTKAVHMLAAPANVTVRDDRAGKRLPGLSPDVEPEKVGYRLVSDLTWKHLLSLDACTKCGKCTAACPAAAAGYPLSPRDLVLDLREYAEGALGDHHSLGLGPRRDPGIPIVGASLRPETLWSCTQCMACVEICPVGIEHVPIINQLRRQLVEQGEMDPLLQSTFETVYKSGNSFGEPKRKRGKWADGLDFPVKDIRKQPAELLWFAGDYASFDPRNQKVSQSLARVLHHAGVDFGLLFDAERTAGCDVRRAGEEGLYSSLAEANVKAIGACEFSRIFSSDPHSYHTLKNEYPSFGGNWTVLHHSELLLELLQRGAIVPARRLDYRVTYHDPCTLGRYNGVYDAPRQVLAAVGVELVEMPRNRDNSLCCGAGGGRIWMKEERPEGVPRVSEQRIEEAVGLGVLDYFVVACPKDLTMYSDAVKTSGHEGELEVRELTELVLEALEIPPAAEEGELAEVPVGS